MQRPTLLCAALVLIVGAIAGTPAYAEYPKIYNFFMDEGKRALQAKDYDDALGHFKNAQLALPSQEEPLRYINLIKKIQEDLIESDVAEDFSRFNVIRSRMKGDAGSLELPPVSVGPAPAPRTPERAGTPVIEAPLSGKRVTTVPQPPFFDQIPAYYLDDELRSTQPGTRLAIELNSAIILEGRHIERFLVITPEFVELERIDSDRVLIHGLKRGSTFVHVWDDRGRWTFFVEVILPVRRTLGEPKIDDIEVYASPFRLSYSADWNAFYDGPSFDELSRRSLNFWQWMETAGETPYGYLDSSLVINKFRSSNEVTGYSVGLTDGRIGNFRDFSIRGFDAAKNLSPLTLPGQYFRGILVESEAFANTLEWTYLRGRSRGTFGFLSPDLLQERDSFFEAGQITLFPREEDQYSFNFARGFGEDRPAYLQERVYSVEFQRRFDDIRVQGEMAYDEENFARTLSTRWGDRTRNLAVSLRDIEEDFTTVASLPSNRGEVGGIVDFNWDFENARISGLADIYRDRFLPNPDNPDALNYDLNTSLDVPLSDSSRWRTSAYYVHTPGEVSPRTNSRLISNYFKTFKVFGDRVLSTSLGGTYQRSRFERSALSEFDRYSLMAGLRMPVIKNLNYYANYEYSWVDELATGEQLQPNVFSTGLNYAKEFLENWIANAGISYRNEENTEGINSFLAGEDSVTGNLGLTYRPSPDFELFVDGRVRNVWAEDPENSAFNELAVSAGVRSAWALPFAWNPRGRIQGIVFKDLNGNQIQDPGEEGIPGVTVNVGRQSVVTDQSGYYDIEVKAREVEVKVDIDTVPSGFIFTTPLKVRANMMADQSQHIHFGLNASTGIYGTVFYDQNGNGKPDPGDTFIPKVRLTLDGEKAVMTDFEGIYLFKEIGPGEHTVTLDVNSLPAEYLPLIKVTNQVTVAEGATFVFHVPVGKK